MDSLLTHGIDPALLRVLEKRSSEHEPMPGRRRPSPAREANQGQNDEQEKIDAPEHELDDLA